MRLHDLSVTAFGPFVETVHVDFDDLAAGGLFLLTGDTGAGKTSVLDAVCFALYGEVPGDRHQARHLRSDRAGPADEARVALGVSVGDRTFRFTRSPAWERPKRRGTGTTKEQARVVVEERRGGEWTTLTNRLDEAGQLVSSLLGMTCTQFTQVAMLPQGRFQSFLRATSTERHAVLQRLFRTRRFEDVERWLAERRTHLRRRCQTCHDRTAGIVNRLQEAAAVSTPDGWDLHDLDPLVDDDVLLGWAHQLVDTAEAEARESATHLTAADARLQQARTDCQHGQRVHEARGRGEHARRSLSQLAATAAAETELAATIDAHRRASSVLPLALQAETATEVARSAELSATRHLVAVVGLLGTPADEVRSETLTRAATLASEARAVAETWLPREAELHDEQDRLRSLSAQLGATEREIGDAEQEHTILAARRGSLLPARENARVSASGIATHELAAESAEAGVIAARQALEVSSRLNEARLLLEQSVSQALDLREHYLDVRERRISGMAAELAVGLAVGCSCPVCGSAEHPSPATSTTSASRTDEDLARGRHETAEFERLARQEAVSALESQLAGAHARSHGHDVAHWQQALAEADTALQECRTAAHRLEELDREAAALEQRDRQLSATLAAARATLEATQQRRLEATKRCEPLAAQLSALLDRHTGTPSVAALVEQHTETVRVLEEACQALTVRDRADRELDRATGAASAAATSAGFSSLGAALASVLPDNEAAARAAQLEARRAARTAAEEVLREESVVDALAVAAPDLDALAGAVREADAARDQVHATARQAALRSSRLQALSAELDHEVAAWQPVRHEHAVTAGLASLVEGRSADNQLKMRLSAYVLSERLRQVVAAANERLGAMTGERYLLEQVDEKGAGEQRGGLSLRIRDEWSGKRRDPATLSGGETFLVSLALALGLADTVSHEAGGTQLDTLFIDEGFGALDATTLDGVMDTLDSLRDGGRVVGLVSHVAELRNRIPSQLEVRKSRRGSTLHASVATG
jgi:exonuclease SbcC